MDKNIEVYKEKMCINCKNKCDNVYLKIYSVSRDTVDFSACTIFLCERFKPKTQVDK